VILRPGGYHIMFVGLKRPFRAGGHIPVELKFAHAPGVRIDFVVEQYFGEPGTTLRMNMPGRPM
jgi:copper(I)-binding protein